MVLPRGGESLRHRPQRGTVPAKGPALKTLQAALSHRAADEHWHDRPGCPPWQAGRLWFPAAGPQVLRLPSPPSSFLSGWKVKVTWPQTIGKHSAQSVYCAKCPLGSPGWQNSGRERNLVRTEGSKSVPSWGRSFGGPRIRLLK